MKRLIGKARVRLGIAFHRASRICFDMDDATDPEWGKCRYCGAKVMGSEGALEPSEQEHAANCPANTGVFPVELRDLWPHGMLCMACEEELLPGDSYSLVDAEEVEMLGGNVGVVVCSGCAVLHGVNKA